jgi:SNF2 family DNA or RNA helicase
MSCAVRRVPPVRVRRARLLDDRPRRLTFTCSIAKPRVVGFRFPDAIAADAPAPCGGGSAVGLPDLARTVGQVSRAALRRALPASRTRVRPPGDVVKLEDRLFYLLQPPLELLLAGDCLVLPSEPFTYQYEGVAFLVPSHAALLADEMGLGKTMQAITAIRMLLRSGSLRSVLLVCPKPLVSNWQREFRIWAEEIPTLAVEGPAERRRWQWNLAQVPVKIANYELLNRDEELFADGRLAFDLVVLDEAQRIKNRDSLTSRAVCGISRRRSWALTGTPIENRPEDLVSIFDFLSPGYLDGSETPDELAQRTAEHVLRRTKGQVLDQLPPKLYRDADVALSPAQRAAYDLAEKEGIVRLGELGDAVRVQHVFELVLRLKQICNFDPATGESAKLERLEADLEEVAGSGAKAIVFSQWVQTLDWLAERLERFRPLCYHGKVPARQRQAVLEAFRDDPGRSVLLLSYGTGSVGLNLQCASYAFLFDRWWNPAVEDQAINRVHRIGQQEPVTVTRFLTTDTVEERIDEVLRQKRALFDQVFSTQRREVDLGLSAADIMNLFELKSPARDADESPLGQKRDDLLRVRPCVRAA